MKAALVGHPYHKKTRSSDFFTQVLEDSGVSVEVFHDDFFYTNGSSSLPELLDGDHDVIFLWQTEYLAPKLVGARKRVVVIPMYDAARQHHPDFWSALTLVRVISFSRTMHNELQEKSLDTNYFQFFPDPAKFEIPDEDARIGRARRGFAWLRRPWDGLDWPKAEALFKAMQLEGGHIHLAYDDDNKAALKEAPLPEIESLGLTTSKWFETKQIYLDAIQACGLYFAPRYFEGIGFSFLEAMAMGLCPVASTTPTMDEYIVDGENGLLYDVGSEAKQAALTADDYARLGLEARRSIERGFERWTLDRERLLDRALNLSRPPARRPDFSAHLRNAPDAAIGRSRNGQPALSVVTVVKDDPDGLSKTAASLKRQAGLDFEYVVIDGASGPETQAEIAKLRDFADTVVSEPDEGPYDAMQKGAETAKGEYVLFLNAGDELFAADTLARAMTKADTNPDFIVGDHVWARKNGQKLHHPAPNFEFTWAKLQTGWIDQKWLSGIPAHQATITRRKLIVDDKYDLRFQIAADHEFMFRQRAKGAQFRHAQETIAVYYEGGVSSERFRRCQAEWYEIANMYGEGIGIHHFYAPILGYDLRVSGLVGREQEKARADIDASSRRDRLAEFRGAFVGVLKRVPPVYNISRSAWRGLRGSRT